MQGCSSVCCSGGVEAGRREECCGRDQTDKNIHPKSASSGLMGKLFMNYLQCT